MAEEKELKVVVRSKADRRSPAAYRDRLKEKIDLTTIDPFSFVNKKYEMLSVIQQASTARRWLGFRAFFKNKLAFGALVMLVITVLLGLIIPATTISPTYFSDNRHLPPLTGEHILGTDLAGRDMWARLWHGFRFSIGLAAVATAFEITLGVIIGLMMGYFRWADKLGQFIIKALNNIPSFFILTLLVLVLNPSFIVMVFAMLISGWIPMANYVRGQVLALKSQEFTTAERSLGASAFTIIRSYLPLVTPVIIMQLVFTLPQAFFYDASLALVGLALPNTATLGNVMYAASETMTIFPLEVVYPVLLLTSVIIYVQFIGGGIEEIVVGVGRHAR